VLIRRNLHVLKVLVFRTFSHPQETSALFQSLGAQAWSVIAKNCYGQCVSKPGVGNLWPAGEMRPS